MATINIEIDTDHDVAYLQLSEKDVQKTTEFSPEINVDLDAYGMVVGLEIISLAALAVDRSSLDSVIRQFHINSSAQALAESALSMLAAGPVQAQPVLASGDRPVASVPAGKISA